MRVNISNIVLSSTVPVGELFVTVSILTTFNMASIHVPVVAQSFEDPPYRVKPYPEKRHFLASGARMCPARNGHFELT